MGARPNTYCDCAKRGVRVSIPLIGSLNCVYRDTWVEYAEKMAGTGIDALELNFYTSEVGFRNGWGCFSK
jgi:hypothetical protein